MGGTVNPAPQLLFDNDAETAEKHAAFCIGAAWLDLYRNRPDRRPDPNELADQLEAWGQAEYSLELVLACGVVSEAVAVVQEWRTKK